MSIRLADGIRVARLQTIVDAIGTSGKIELFSGTQPPSAGGVYTGTKLGTLNLSVVSGTISSNVLTFNPVSNDVSADDAGFCTWGRVMTSNDVFVLDFDCGTTASVAVMKFTDTLFAQGDIIEVVSFKLTEANG